MNSQLPSNIPSYALIGHPVEHSLSAKIHAANFAALGINAQYSLIDVSPDKLSFVNSRNLCGFNVTAPHKEAYMSQVDDADFKSRQIGAINTVVNRDGKLYATNTDGRGFVRGLETSFAGSSVLIIGAGGAARSIAYELCSTWPRVDITNRTYEKAVAVAKKMNLNSAKPIESIERTLASYDLIVNTTSSSSNDESPIDVSRINRGTHVVDIATRRTAFLKDAHLAGATIQDGTNMLVWQAAYAFEFWFKRKADTKAMFAALRR